MNADFGDVSIIVSQQEAAEIWNKIESLDTELGTKVDAEEGKGLSSNDYTDAEKAKLEGIAEGAEVNVQANWNETDTTDDDFIQNKPNTLTTVDISEIIDALD